MPEIVYFSPELCSCRYLCIPTFAQTISPYRGRFPLTQSSQRQLIVLFTEVELETVDDELIEDVGDKDTSDSGLVMAAEPFCSSMAVAEELAALGDGGDGPENSPFAADNGADGCGGGGGSGSIC